MRLTDQDWHRIRGAIASAARSFRSLPAWIEHADLEQEGWVRVLARLRTWPPHLIPLGAWAFREARGAMVDHLRRVTAGGRAGRVAIRPGFPGVPVKHERSMQEEVPLHGEEDKVTLGDTLASTEDIARVAVDRLAVRRALAQLDDQELELILATVVAGHPKAEYGRRMGIRHAEAVSRILRGAYRKMSRELCSSV